jgi:hypothetical protein
MGEVRGFSNVADDLFLPNLDGLRHDGLEFIMIPDPTTARSSRNLNIVALCG